MLTKSEIKSFSKGHFFSKDTMRFFSSRIETQGLIKGQDVFFLTSEKSGFSDNSRAYTLRILNLETGSVDTVGEFLEFKTRKEALDAWRACR